MDIPKPHNSTQKVAVVIGGAVAAGFILYTYRASKAANADATDVPTDPTAVDAGTDTGYDDGSYAGSDYGDYGGGFAPPVYGSGYGGTYTGGTTDASETPVTNGQWAQLVESYLADRGYNEQTVSSALGKYLNKRSLNDNEIAIVQAGIAFYGMPPNNVGTPIKGPATPTTPTKPAVPKVANGYYRNITTGYVYQVQSNTRYLVSRATWTKLRKQRPAPVAKVVLANSPVFKLPKGQTI